MLDNEKHGQIYEENHEEEVAKLEKAGLNQQGMKDSRISTIVCTHPGFLEDMNFIMSPMAPGFTPKAEVKNVPFFSTFLNSMESFYVNRAASPEETNKLLERIM